MPAETALTAAYWAAARRGVILLQRCGDCGVVVHPPTPVCPGGVGHGLEWFEASGFGRLASFTSVVHAAHPAVLDRLPYLVALVELDEGPRIVCNLTPGQTAEPGARVVFRLALAAGGLELPVAYLAPDPLQSGRPLPGRQCLGFRERLVHPSAQKSPGSPKTPD